MKNKLVFLLLACFLFASCQSKARSQESEELQENKTAPTFNADSAYSYIDRQVSFGPRVPNTEAHEACAAFLISELERHGARVIAQKTDLTAYDGTILHTTNIIGSYQPENPKRVLLFAHWDSRPWADHDPDPTKHHTPILGANDGASGVGVLLEIARLLHSDSTQIGVDLIFFDAEDYGTPQWDQTGRRDETTWCLGSQFWAKNPHVENYNARFGILLDMVGGKDARFYQEGYSRQTAKWVVDKVWSQAASLDYSHFFITQPSGGVIDDHYFVNKLARIPCIDIIPTDTENHGFGYFWHTEKDNMDVIDKTTLKAVGQTVTSVIYSEK